MSGKSDKRTVEVQFGIIKKPHVEWDVMAKTLTFGPLTDAQREELLKVWGVMCGIEQ